MVTGFNLEIKEKINPYTQYIDDYEKMIGEYKTSIFENIDNYVIDGFVDGTKVEQDWFPKINADIFISHSHKDEALAKGLAGWIYKEFKLICFVDSCVWGYSDDLLEKINKKYSDWRRKEDGSGFLYNHFKSNMACKHVDTILTIALYKMIDKTETTFLLNTDNSISKYADVYNQSTYSPWIYSEIICTELIRKKPLADYRPEENEFLEHKENKRYYTENTIPVKYKTSLEHLVKIDYEDLNKWKKKYDEQRCSFPLDCLYDIKNLDVK